MTPFQEKIKGSIPALLTALTKDFAVDAEAIRKTARRAIDNGSQGVVVLGTSGEFASIDDDQRQVAIRAAIDEIGKEAPVIVGCGLPNVKLTHEQAKEAADLGADGILVNPPFYFPMDQDEIVTFFDDLVKASPIPVMLYNIPSMTKIAVEPATIPKLRDVGVQGTKDSSGIPANTLAYLKALGPNDDFRVVVGGEAFFLHLLDAGVCATTGLMPGVAPQLAAHIYDAWQKRDYETGFAAQHRANAFASILRRFHSFAHATGKGILSRLEIMEKWVAPPKASLSDEKADQAFEAAKPYLPEFDSD